MRWTIRGFEGQLDELDLHIVKRDGDELPVALIQGWFMGEYVTGTPETVHPSFGLDDVTINNPQRLEALVRHLLQRFLLTRKRVIEQDPDTEHSGPGSYDWARNK